jgi:hypothetical protein
MLFMHVAPSPLLHPQQTEPQRHASEMIEPQRQCPQQTEPQRHASERIEPQSQRPKTDRTVKDNAPTKRAISALATAQANLQPSTS